MVKWCYWSYKSNIIDIIRTSFLMRHPVPQTTDARDAVAAVCRCLCEDGLISGRGRCVFGGPDTGSTVIGTRQCS